MPREVCWSTAFAFATSRTPAFRMPAVYVKCCAASTWKKPEPCDPKRCGYECTATIHEPGHGCDATSNSTNSFMLVLELWRADDDVGTAPHSRKMSKSVSPPSSSGDHIATEMCF